MSREQAAGKFCKCRRFIAGPAMRKKGRLRAIGGESAKTKKSGLSLLKTHVESVCNCRQRSQCGRGPETNGWRTGGGGREGRAAGTGPSPEAVGMSLRDRGARGRSRTGSPYVRKCARRVERSPTRPRHRASTTGGTPPFRDMVLVGLVKELHASATASIPEQCGPSSPPQTHAAPTPLGCSSALSPEVPGIAAVAFGRSDSQARSARRGESRSGSGRSRG